MKKGTHKGTVIVHSVDGFEETVEFVEIDGNKFEADPNDKTKAKVGEDGKPVPFKAKEDDPKDPKDPEKKPKEGDTPKKVEDMTLDELKKAHPELAKHFNDHEDLVRKAKEKEEEDERKERERAEKAGEWQKIADTEKEKRVKAEETLAQKEEQLGKYVESTKKMLKSVIETIPEENRTLIPEDFSPRQQLEYIMSNMQKLGAKINGAKGGGVPPNDDDPNLSAVDKLRKEVDELAKKENKTPVEKQLYFEKSKQLKQMQAAQ